MLILRFCPYEISKPSLTLFESAMTTMEGNVDVRSSFPLFVSVSLPLSLLSLSV
jgi:hypothetical protein